MDSAFFTGFTSDLSNPSLWAAFYRSHPSISSSSNASQEVPPVPKINGEEIFWEMMRVSRTPDPWMYPALKKLKKSGKYILAALSNTVIFPEGHPYSVPPPPALLTSSTPTTHTIPPKLIISPPLTIQDPSTPDIRTLFSVFISSAHVGLRKPDPKIYALALAEVDAYARSQSDPPPRMRVQDSPSVS